MVFAFTIYMYRAEYIFIGAILDRTSIYIYIPTYIWCHLIYRSIYIYQRYMYTEPYLTGFPYIYTFLLIYGTP
jgi:hypothetical protein